MLVVGEIQVVSYLLADGLADVLQVCPHPFVSVALSANALIVKSPGPPTAAVTFAALYVNAKGGVSVSMSENIESTDVLPL